MKRGTVVGLAAVLLVVIAAVFAGCGDDTGAPEGSTPTTSVPARTAPDTAPKPGPVASFRLVFLRGEERVTVVRRTGGGAALREAVEALLAGPDTEEAAQGLTTAIPSGTRLDDLDIENGVASIDFSAEMLDYGGGSAMVQAITDQVEGTVFANEPTVREVRITVEGKPAEEVLQP